MIHFSRYLSIVDACTTVLCNGFVRLARARWGVSLIRENAFVEAIRSCHACYPPIAWKMLHAAESTPRLFTPLEAFRVLQREAAWPGGGARALHRCLMPPDLGGPLTVLHDTLGAPCWLWSFSIMASFEASGGRSLFAFNNYWACGAVGGRFRRSFITYLLARSSAVQQYQSVVGASNRFRTLCSGCV